MNEFNRPSYNKLIKKIKPNVKKIEAIQDKPILKIKPFKIKNKTKKYF